MGVIQVLQALALLEPLVADVIPIIQKQLAGTALNDADLAALRATADAIDAKIAALQAAQPAP